MDVQLYNDCGFSPARLPDAGHGQSARATVEPCALEPGELDSSVLAYALLGAQAAARRKNWLIARSRLKCVEMPMPLGHNPSTAHVRLDSEAEVIDSKAERCPSG